jgi:hypothetical protein
MSGNPFSDPAIKRSFDEMGEELEATPIFRETWPAKNTKVLEAARLPLNPLVLGLVPPVVRCYVRLAAAVESFGCDILSTATMKHERPANLAELGRAHLLEITQDGLFKLHRLTLEYPSRFDLLDD